MRASVVRMPRILLGHTLDLNSTVLCWYGDQEGSQIGYSRPSHHPLLAFVRETQRLLWVALRPGKAGPANGCIEWLRQAIKSPWSGPTPDSLCLGSFGFFAQNALPYIIMARLTPVLRRLVIHRLPETAWRRVSPGITVAETLVTLPCWKGQVRRMVCLRQALRERPQAARRRLIECAGLPSQLIVPSVPYADEVVCCMQDGPIVKTGSRSSKTTSPWIPFACSPLRPPMRPSGWAVSPTTCWPAFGRPSCRGVGSNGGCEPFATASSSWEPI